MGCCSSPPSPGLLSIVQEDLPRWDWGIQLGSLGLTSLHARILDILFLPLFRVKINAGQMVA